jgi:aspartyl-tRNA(Asn)/glutamyl-tRNA(Gln) amidotransferase subunit C
VNTAADDERDRVAWTARLSRLALGANEAQALARDLESVLAHVAVLEELDTRGVEPFVPVVVATDPWRDDVVAPGLSRTEALAQAPVERSGQFWVPRIVSAAAEGETSGESR